MSDSQQHPALLHRAVFLDRDGVINRALVRQGRPYPPATLDELEFLPGAVQAVHDLHQAGFRLIIVTNQPDVATGIQSRAVVEAMHAHLRRTMPLDDIKVCYHVDRDQCSCRKPKPGMLLEAASAGRIDLEQSYMVGDRWRDIDAGKAARCKTLYVRGDYQERKPEHPDATVDSLLEASVLILSHAL